MGSVIRDGKQESFGREKIFLWEMKREKKMLCVLRDKKERKGTLMILIIIKTCQVFRP